MPREKTKLPRAVRYYARETQELRDGTEIERNGDLSYVEDSETGECRWLANFEIKLRGPVWE